MMSSRIALAAAALAAAFATTGCGLTSSPADNLTFQAPAGWSGSPGIMGFMQFWKAPNDKEILMLVRSPKPMKQDEVFNSAKMKDTTVEDQQDITICGSQPATFVRAKGHSSNGGTTTDDDVQMVMTTAGGATYFALYIYPANAKPDPAAVAATRELCTKSNS